MTEKKLSCNGYKDGEFGCKYYEEIKNTGHSKIFKCPYCRSTVEIFWNGEKVFIDGRTHKKTIMRF